MTGLIHKLRNRRANAVVELALVLPLITASLVFVADIGAATHRNMTLKSAVRAGAEYMLRTNDADGMPAVVAAAANRDLEALTVTTSQFCTCGTVTVSCGATCAEGTQQHMSVAVSEPYTPILVPTLGGEPDAMVRMLNAQATFRIK